MSRKFKFFCLLYGILGLTYMNSCSLQMGREFAMDQAVKVGVAKYTNKTRGEKEVRWVR